ncbi:5'/3'-nucleotidase SurE [Caldicoprobacter faecalis]|uniref:5'-nucleotidase SurE n=1 Tax=Caldicoprobacter faecalis TaxID=937334 RepID=A0A1I5UBF4_9FIRM|nr:5'/3'-nucleotidase SurE [Caldicoprobacter faecalis]SFP92267.1 5'-nucleotidase /3'-nucleotidase /exopolyphosphatase [Caldicoprobacter faecalis]
MRILVCNDDGISSKGIIQLAQSMSRIGEVVVAAPDEERSATGHAITLHKPLRIEPVKLPDVDVEAYSVNGTPADCVKIGVDVIMKRKVDLVISGINRGPNLGTDVIYSGTVSAAIEGCILGIPSVAISLVSYESNDFSYAGEVAVEVTQKLLQHGLPRGALLNVNVPAVPKEEIKGIKVVRLGIRRYAETYIKRLDLRGKPYYWLTGEAIETSQEDMQLDTDIAAVSQNYIAITPIHLDLTLYPFMDAVASWFKGQ